MTKSDGDIVNTYKNGDVLNVVGINLFGEALYKHGREENFIYSTEYLVLDGYEGDEEEKRAAEIARLEKQKSDIWRFTRMAPSATASTNPGLRRK